MSKCLTDSEIRKYIEDALHGPFTDKHREEMKHFEMCVSCSVKHRQTRRKMLEEKEVRS